MLFLHFEFEKLKWKRAINIRTENKNNYWPLFNGLFSIPFNSEFISLEAIWHRRIPSQKSSVESIFAESIPIFERNGFSAKNGHQKKREEN